LQFLTGLAKFEIQQIGGSYWLGLLAFKMLTSSVVIMKAGRNIVVPGIGEYFASASLLLLSD